MGGPPGGFGRFGEFQKQHQYAFELTRLVRSIGRLEQDKKNALNPKQAKSVLAVLQPLRKRTNLDEAAAKKGLNAVQSVLTNKQRAAISALPPEHPFRRNGPPPSGPRPGERREGRPGFGPPPGPGPRFDMKSFNPLNPPAFGPPNQQRSGGMNKVFDDLKKKSSKR